MSIIICIYNIAFLIQRHKEANKTFSIVYALLYGIIIIKA